MPDQRVYAVSQVNEYIKSLLENSPGLGDIYVRGELSNYKIYPSGHHYFTMKDESGALRCVMFRSSASRLRFRPENGMKVIARGRVSVFPGWVLPIVLRRVVTGRDRRSVCCV